jgi:hypothetical protein
MSNRHTNIMDMLARIGIDLLDLADGYRKVRARYLPGQLEYEHATGALMAIDHIADRAMLALTSGAPGLPGSPSARPDPAKAGAGKVTRLPGVRLPGVRPFPAGGGDAA